MTSDDDFEPHHSSSPTDHVLTELQLYGFRPFQGEADPRPARGGQGLALRLFDTTLFRRPALGGPSAFQGPSSAAGTTATPSGRRYAARPVVTITRSIT